MGSTGARGVQAKPTQETEAIQDLRAPAGRDQLGYTLMVDLLVEIETSLVAAQHVHFEAQPVEVDRHRTLNRSREDAIGVRQALELARGSLVPFDESARRKQSLQGGEDHRLALVHAERGGLHDKHVLVFVHDQAA